MATISNLTKHMLWLFGKGDISAGRLQRLASAAASDGVYNHDELLQKISKAGQSGQHSGNIHRDIIRACRAAGLMNSAAQPYIVTLPNDQGTANVFLPHEVYSDLAAEVGLQNLHLKPEELLEEHGLGDLLRAWGSHPDVGIAADQLQQIGIVGMHCDGVPYTTSNRAGSSKSVFAASLNVVSSPDDRIRARRQPLFLLRKARLCSCGCQGFHTFQALFEVLSWSMSFLMTGTWPACRHDGTAWSAHDRKSRALSGVLPRAALLQIRGDWEFFAQAFRFRSYNSLSFCWLCDASLRPGLLSFTNMQPDAPHRQTLLGHDGFIAACAREHSEPSHVFRSPGTLLTHVAVDSMHAGDLGVFQDLLGSVLWLEVNNRQWPGTRPQKLQRLRQEMQAYYAANKSKGWSEVGELTYSMIYSKSVGYPYLKAKAAQTRHLADFGLALAHRHLQGSGDRAPLRFAAGHHLHGLHEQHLHLTVAAMEGMVGYHRACAAEPFDRLACKNSMYLCLQSMSSLNALWRRDLEERHHGVQPFHLRPKAHMLQHLVEEQTLLWGSPARSWCYRDEDFVGAVKLVAGKSKHPASLETLVSEKLMLLSGLGAHL